MSSIDTRAAAIASETKRDILSIVKAQRCNLHPQAMSQLIRASAVLPTKEDRVSFLTNVIVRSRLSADRTIELKAAQESISALLPSLQAENMVSVSDLGVLQAIATSSTQTNVNTQAQQLHRQKSHAAALAQASGVNQRNFKVVQEDEVPVVSIDEATCAAYRVGLPSHRAQNLRDMAVEAERARSSVSGNSASASASASGSFNAVAALEAAFSRRSESSPRTTAIRLRLALATGRVLRSSKFVAASLLASIKNNSNNNNNNNAKKNTVYRISALDGLQNNQSVTLVGMLRFAPWLVQQNANSLFGSSTSSSSSSSLGKQNNNNNNNTNSNSFADLNGASFGWLLEDFTGQISLLLSQAFLLNIQNLSNSLIGDGVTVVIQGNWTGNSVAVRYISLPPGESRAQTASHLGAIDDYFGARPSDVLASTRAFADSAAANVAILVSDVRISIPANSSKLLKLMREFESRKGEVDLSKVTFVLVGDFVVHSDGTSNASSSSSASADGSGGNMASSSSRSARALDASYFGQDRSTISITTDYDSLGGDVLQTPEPPTPASVLTQTLRDFAALVASQAPTVASQSEFVLIPGPNDCCATAAGAYPRAPLYSGAVAAFAERVPRTSAATNPCRLRFLTQEYVVCRAPLHRTFAASSLVTLEGKSNPNLLLLQQQQQQQQNQLFSADGSGVSSSSSSKKEPFAELAEMIVRNSVWFPVPSEGVLSADNNQSGGNATGTFGFTNNNNNNNRAGQDSATSAAGGGGGGGRENEGAATTGAAAKNKQKPALLRSWGSVRWSLDRQLYHGGVPHPPHLSLMCDDTSCWSCSVDDVVCANPGSFAQSGIFAWISPSDRSVEFNQLPN